MFNFFISRRNRCYRNMVYTLISFSEAKEMILNSQDYILIDVRSKKEYDFMHIVNAVNIPVAKLRMCEREYNSKKGIILYCSSGQRTKEAIIILNNMGYSNLYIWEFGSITNFPYKDMLKI